MRVRGVPFLFCFLFFRLKVYFCTCDFSTELEIYLNLIFVFCLSSLTFSFIIIPFGDVQHAHVAVVMSVAAGMYEAPPEHNIPA